MLNSTGELEFSNEEDAEIISQLTSLALSDGKSSAGAPEKTGYPDSVYVMAANIFQGIRIEKSAQKVLIKYGNEPLRSFSESEDQSFQRLSYELAFSALKCELCQSGGPTLKENNSERIWGMQPSSSLPLIHTRFWFRHVHLFG